MRRKRRQSGFTLLEATMAMVLLAIAAAGVLLPFAGAADEQTQGVRQTIAAQLASELMEKIINTPFNSIIATYNGYTETKGNLLDMAGVKRLPTSYPVYAGFSRQAICEAATAASVNMIAVTVIVFYEGAEVTRVKTLVGNHS